jgi:2-methylisocitrate lyase-like PEP mutase family enzyme
MARDYNRPTAPGAPMMQQSERARELAALHVKGAPLLLYNAWDAGSAKAIAAAGARAIATSSWAVAAAHGYADGEAIPLSLVEAIVARVVASVALPVTVDVEGGYSDDPRACAGHVARIVDLGIAGINFEDRVVSGTGLHPVALQCARIAAIRAMADARGVPLFINARSDVFFGSGIAIDEGLAQARARAQAYATAGASGFFVPGLVDAPAIAALCASVALPVNVMQTPNLPSIGVLAAAGVARLSFGPASYLRAMDAVRAGAREVYGAR